MTLESLYCVGGVNLVCCEDEESAIRLPLAFNTDSTLHNRVPLHVLNPLLNVKLHTCYEVSKPL